MWFLSCFSSNPNSSLANLYVSNRRVYKLCQVNLMSQSEDLPRQQRFEVMNWSYLDFDGPGEVAIFYGL